MCRALPADVAGNSASAVGEASRVPGHRYPVDPASNLGRGHASAGGRWAVPLTGTVLRTAQQYPDRVAIGAGGQQLGYAELVADSRRAFAAVAHLHAAQHDPPAPARETGGIPVTAVSLTSAFHTGRILAGLAGYRAVSAAIDPRWPLEHQVGVVMGVGIGVVISDSEELHAALRAAGWGGSVITLDDFVRLENDVAPADPPAVRDGDEPFLLLFSSGTTRHPKAFLKTRGQYRANFAVSSAHLEPLPGAATLAPGPVSYSLTLYALIECLASGGSAYLADSFDPIAAGSLIREHAISRVVAVPAIVSSLAVAARREPARFGSLELIVTGGANLSTVVRGAIAEALPRVRVISYYGAAEIGFIGDSRDGDGTLIDVYDGVAASIRRGDGSEITGDDELGTLWIRAAACSDGYIAGTADEELVDANGWATVHDQARWSAGRLHLVGRAGDVIVTGGHKVSLAEVERAFEGAPGIGASCAISLPDARRGAIVALVVEPAPGTATAATAEAGRPRVDRTALVAIARQRLAPQFVPRRWFRVATLPRTVGGKIRREATAELVRTAAAGVDRL